MFGFSTLSVCKLIIFVVYNDLITRFHCHYDLIENQKAGRCQNVNVTPC